MTFVDRPQTKPENEGEGKEGEEDDPPTATEWVRHMVCCAHREVDNAAAASATTATASPTAASAPTPAGAPAATPSGSPAVVLAVLAPTPDTVRPLSTGDAAQNKHNALLLVVPLPSMPPITPTLLLKCARAHGSSGGGSLANTAAAVRKGSVQAGTREKRATGDGTLNFSGALCRAARTGARITGADIASVGRRERVRVHHVHSNLPPH
ncbi:hypothetical protein MSAN_01142800 [Mycena sanguinolenta]|uniref:Uncharacterized protein n=1 Tax=Mycena sanguinolenta TaxID=230812 RepID=A0A8H6YL80_9AGAR|nr:hypothetical protein MSAN_01142800 [Mycena sanguinolenta]